MKLGPKEIKVVNEYFVRPVKNRLKEIFMKKGLPQLRTADEIKQPPVRKDVEDIQAINEFMKRNPKADGGRIPFAKAMLVQKKSEASYKAYEDKFGKKLLDKAAQDKYGKNFRELDKTNELKFFKNQVNKYEDFIKENKRYPTTSEAYNIGLTQGGKKSSIMTDEVKTKIKNIYTSGEGGSTYISKKLGEEGINIDDSTIRRFITAEEEAGNIVRPKKFKTQEAKAPKDRYNIIREVTDRDLRGFTVGRSGTEVLAPKGSKYKITFNVPRSSETTKIPSAYQGTQYYKTKAQADKAIAGSKKFSKDLIKQGKANRGLREIILEQVSDPNIESAIVRMKEGEDLATAHRLSYKQVGKLGELYNIANLGIEDPAINSGAIRKFENKLDLLYQEQRNLMKSAKRSTNKGLPVPKTLQDKIDLNNKKISTVVDLTDRRIQGILIDTKTLKPTTYGIDYMKTYGMGLLKNKNVKDITDADLATIQLNIQNQIKRENKLGKKTESFLRDRQKFIKNVDELAGPQGAEVAKKIGLRSKNIGGGVTLGANPMFSPGILKEAFKQLPTPAGAVGLNLLFGVDPTSSIDRASIAAEAAFAPALVKQAAKLGTVGQKIANLGLTPAMAARAARIASPLGILSLGAEGLYQGGKFTKKRIEELRSMTPEQREELRRQGEAQAFDPFQAAGGGIAKQSGDRSGAMLTSMNPDKDGLPGLLKRGKKQ